MWLDQGVGLPLSRIGRYFVGEDEVSWWILGGGGFISWCLRSWVKLYNRFQAKQHVV